jgi:alkylmercury lyase
MKNPNLDEIVKSLHEAGIPPYISEGQSRLFIEVLRLVGKGQPVSPEQVKEIIVTLKLSPDETDEAISLIKKVSETDNNNIVGLFGLSQENHPHRFQINSHVLSTWCAWDTLFLPSLLKQTAKVESLCPVTKEKIQLRLSPEKVEQSEPKNAVLSIVVPKPTEDGSSYGSEIRMLFCQFVRFFSSRDVAIEWFKGKGYDPIVLPIEEGYQLGRMAFKEVLKYA